MKAQEKLGVLENRLKDLGSLVVAFSGGVDSTFLLKVAHGVLKERVMAVIARSSTFPKRELNQALFFVEEQKIDYKVIVSEELEVEGFADNPLNRCYLCKRELFGKIKEIARKQGFEHVAEGSNIDDLSDYRPGMKAIEELGILSPLKDVEMTKDEIRQLSKNLGLKTWNKPAFACLSSRFPYGEKITIEKLEMVNRAEEFLLSMGFLQCRVRHHGSVARIEVDEEEIDKFLDKKIRDKTYKAIKEVGFLYVALDLKGYRTGSMNEGSI